MPEYQVELDYLVSKNQTITVTAKNPDDAFRKAEKQVTLEEKPHEIKIEDTVLILQNGEVCEHSF